MEKLNGHFICEKEFQGLMTKGKVYTIVNGVITRDNGTKYFTNSVKEYNEHNISKISPYPVIPKSLIEHLDTVIQQNGVEYVAILKGKDKRFVGIDGGKNDYDIFNCNLLWDGVDDKYKIMTIISPSGQVKWQRSEKSQNQIEKEAIQAEMEKLTKRLEKLEAK